MGMFYSTVTGPATLDSDNSRLIVEDSVLVEVRGNTEDICTVVVPQGVEKIGRNVFLPPMFPPPKSGSSKLTSVAFPETLTSIESSAFSYCVCLRSLALPESLTFIGESAFSNCTSLTSLTLPRALKKIGAHAFSDCTGITSLVLPEALTEVGVCAFARATGLTCLSLPDDLGTVGRAMFLDCTSLASVNFRSPSPFAFIAWAIGISRNRTNWQLTTVKQLRNVLRLIVMFAAESRDPNRSGNIGHATFRGCTSLTSVALPGTFSCVPAFAFSGCSGLTSVTLPHTLTRVGRRAFEGCTSLTSINFPSNLSRIDEHAFFECSGLISLTFPACLATIGEYAFSCCTSITSVTFPDTYFHAGNAVFVLCKSLSTIVFRQPVSLAFVTWVVGSSRNRDNWEHTSMKELSNVLRLIAMFVVRRRSFDLMTWNRLFKGCTNLMP